jgi:hypothetical protein
MPSFTERSIVLLQSDFQHSASKLQERSTTSQRPCLTEVVTYSEDPLEDSQTSDQSIKQVVRLLIIAFAD